MLTAPAKKAVATAREDVGGVPPDGIGGASVTPAIAIEGLAELVERLAAA